MTDKKTLTKQLNFFLGRKQALERFDFSKENYESNEALERDTRILRDYFVFTKSTSDQRLKWAAEWDAYYREAATTPVHDLFLSMRAAVKADNTDRIKELLKEMRLMRENKHTEVLVKPTCIEPEEMIQSTIVIYYNELCSKIKTLTYLTNATNVSAEEIDSWAG